MSGPFPEGTHGDTTNVGTRTPYGVITGVLKFDVAPSVFTLGDARISAIGGTT
jgi:hypothetical protein